MNFEFATATRIVFGAGKRNEVFPAAEKLGKRCLIVGGSGPGRAKWLEQGFAASDVQTQFFPIPGEPTLHLVQQGADLARAHQSHFVVAIGGGSAMDAGKAIAALASNTGDLIRYLEVIGEGKPLENPPLPCITIPTTAGTGAEVTRNAVLGSPEHQLKVSLRSPRMLPVLALVDPELTYELPPRLTASTGMDTVTQLIEPFLSARANPITDALCREMIPRAARALPAAYENGANKAAREEMSLASLGGGLALANAGLGVVHGFAAPVGGMLTAPHGAVCAALLPHALRANYHALSERAPNSEALRRFSEIARLLTAIPNAAPEDGIHWIERLCVQLQIPPLAVYGLDAESIPLLCERAAQASSMKANPITLNPGELAEILGCAMSR
ncbi:MAG TPA: iron-containing alcohol dehydrogenase [Verrucomicrobiae bacterium]|jgi:alcohol dehydrogenase class IV|nr:iron-containing alcohol dehydrogenase [Verrucomicrobiae bacterium]